MSRHAACGYQIPDIYGNWPSLRFLTFELSSDHWTSCNLFLEIFRKRKIWFFYRLKYFKEVLFPDPKSIFKTELSIIYLIYLMNHFMAELKKDLRFISHRCGQDSENDISARETLTSNILQSFHTSVDVDTQVYPPISPGSWAPIINI